MRRTTIISLGVVLILCSTVVLGQSGRKQKKTPELPPVQGVPTPSKTPEPPPSDVPEPTPEDEKEKEKKKATAKGIVLGTDWSNMDVSMGTADYVRQSCRANMQRMMRGLEIRDTGGMSRSDAVKMAKDEDRFYVVALEFSTLSRQLDVRFTIYEPKTAKVVGTGSAWIQTDAYGRVSIYSYERAGRDLAQQILGRVNLRAAKIP